MLSLSEIKSIKGYKKHVEILNFLIRLNIFAIPLYLILALDLSLPQIQYFIADITFYLLNAAGMSPSINGLLISIPIKNGSWGAFINWDCTAWKSMLAFFALMMATGVNNKTRRNGRYYWRYLDPRIKGLIIFIPLIFVINIIRIFFMFFYVKTFDIAYYQIVHTIVWSWGMIFVILMFWAIWMKKIR